MINNNIRKYFKEFFGLEFTLITSVLKQNHQLNALSDFSEWSQLSYFKSLIFTLTE